MARMKAETPTVLVRESRQAVKSCALDRSRPSSQQALNFSEAAWQRPEVMASKLLLRRVDLHQANAFVREHHRHHRPVVGHKFSLGAVLNDALVGIAIIGRPVSRMRDDGDTLEVSRLCTDGTRNACSFLYGAAARACFALGYRRIGTYLLASESGASVLAAGWRCLGERGGGSWSVPSRPRTDKFPTEKKMLFEMVQ